jgi:hypothetical protein
VEETQDAEGEDAGFVEWLSGHVDGYVMGWMDVVAREGRFVVYNAKRSNDVNVN